MDIESLLIPIIAAVSGSIVTLLFQKIDRRAQIALKREAYDAAMQLKFEDPEATRRAKETATAVADAIVNDVRLLTRHGIDDSLVAFRRRSWPYRVLRIPDPAGVINGTDGLAMAFTHYIALILAVLTLLRAATSWEWLQDWQTHMMAAAIIFGAFITRDQFWKAVYRDRPYLAKVKATGID